MDKFQKLRIGQNPSEQINLFQIIYEMEGSGTKLNKHIHCPNLFLKFCSQNSLFLTKMKRNKWSLPILLAFAILTNFWPSIQVNGQTERSTDGGGESDQDGDRGRRTDDQQTTDDDNEEEDDQQQEDDEGDGGAPEDEEEDEDGEEGEGTANEEDEEEDEEGEDNNGGGGGGGRRRGGSGGRVTGTGGNGDGNEDDEEEEDGGENGRTSGGGGGRVGRGGGRGTGGGRTGGTGNDEDKDDEEDDEEGGEGGNRRNDRGGGGRRKGNGGIRNGRGRTRDEDEEDGGGETGKTGSRRARGRGGNGEDEDDDDDQQEEEEEDVDQNNDGRKIRSRGAGRRRNNDENGRDGRGGARTGGRRQTTNGRRTKGRDEEDEEDTDEKEDPNRAGRRSNGLELLRCQNRLGQFLPIATVCKDRESREFCERVFPSRDVNSHGRPRNCDLPGLKEVAKGCAHQCRICCELKEHGCGDDQRYHINCAAQIDMCHNMTMLMTAACASTCGLCATGACVDTADGCIGMRNLCNETEFEEDMQKCARTCGFCTPKCADVSEKCLIADEESCDQPPEDHPEENPYYESMIKVCRQRCHLCDKTMPLNKRIAHLVEERADEDQRQRDVE